MFLGKEKAELQAQEQLCREACETLTAKMEELKEAVTTATAIQDRHKQELE